jgi:hypothetical protein
LGLEAGSGEGPTGTQSKGTGLGWPIGVRRSARPRNMVMQRGDVHLIEVRVDRGGCLGFDRQGMLWDGTKKTGVVHDSTTPTPTPDLGVSC